MDVLHPLDPVFPQLLAHLDEDHGFMLVREEFVRNLDLEVLVFVGEVVEEGLDGLFGVGWFRGLDLPYCFGEG
jgi:hypothetical protein